MKKNLCEAQSLFDEGVKYLGSSKTLSKGIRLLEKAHRLGSPYALYRLALIARRSDLKDYPQDLEHSDRLLEEAKPLLEAGCSDGLLPALSEHYLADYCLKGWAKTPIDIEKGLALEASASDSGLLEASVYLAGYYGEAEHQDAGQAEFYTRRAEEQKAAGSTIADAEEDQAAPIIAEDEKKTLEIEAAIPSLDEGRNVQAISSGRKTDLGSISMRSREFFDDADAVEDLQLDEMHEEETVLPLAEDSVPADVEVAAPLPLEEREFDVRDFEPIVLSNSESPLPTVTKLYYPSEMFLPRTKRCYVDPQPAEEELTPEYQAHQNLLKALRLIERKEASLIPSALKLLSEVERVLPREVNILLGDLYLSGKLLENDLVQAIKRYELAESFGSPYASYQLGTILLAEASGELTDPDRGMRYLRRAATAGFPAALTAIGDLHRAGKMGPINRQAAYDFYRLAAERGDREAYLGMADIDQSRGDEELAATHRAAARV